MHNGALLVLFLVLAAEFVNGVTDAPNAIATVVSTPVLRPLAAAVMAAVFNIVGALATGNAVASTIGKGFARPEVISLSVVAASMITIILWSAVTWRIQGHFERSYVAATPLVVFRDSTGCPLAFVNEIPSNRPGEENFDMMRHVPRVPPGTMEYIFTELMLALKQEGYRSFDLGLAPFAGVGDRPEATIGERAVHQLFDRLFWFVSYKGLRNYKVKFEPDWEDRFLVYQGGPVGLVRLALAIGRALE